MMILSAIHIQMREKLQNSGVETAALDARLLLQHVLNASHADMIANPDRKISDEEASRLYNMTERRASGEPVSKIIGMKEFYGRDFIVTADTLDPRPETEVLIECALRFAKESDIALSHREREGPRNCGEGEGLKILDLGTGTGCIALTLLLELPDARAICVDVSDAALEITKNNAEKHGVLDRVTFIQSNWFENITDSYDLIVSNPPYIPESDIESLSKDVRKFDPILALNGGGDGLNPYKIIFSHLHAHLNYGGAAFFEIGFLQSEDITRLVKESRIRMVGITPDIAGIPRVVEISTGEK